VKTKIIAVVNQKGGVGKTTTVVNLATAMCSLNKRVMIIDIDPQGNACTSLGIEQNQRQQTIYDVLVTDMPMEKAIIDTEIPNLSIVPSNIHLSAASSEMFSMANREYILQQKLAKLMNGNYDYIFIDCPPALSILTINALVAAQQLIIPLQCEFLALEGLAYLLNTVKKIQKHLNRELRIGGIVMTMHDRRNKLSSSVLEEVQNEMGNMVFKTIIPRNVRLSEAPSHGKPAIIYDTNCAGSVMYIQLAREFIKKN